MWKYIFQSYVKSGNYNKQDLLYKLERLQNAGVLMNGEYQEILIIINEAFPE